MRAGELLLVLAAAACVHADAQQATGVAPASREQRGAIEGTVRAAGEPLAGVPVGLGRVETKTDAAGRYSLRDVEPGRHTVRVGDPFRSPAVPESRTISVTPGQTVAADFAMILQASAAGVILDEFDEPVPGVEVVLLAREFHAGAARLYRRHAARTTDQGEFRFEYVRPGVPYLMLAGSPLNPPPDQAKSEAPTDSRLRRRATLPTFFPGVAEAAGATPIILRPGEHREAVNVRLQRGPSYCIEAQVAAAGARAPDVTVQVHAAHVPYGMGPNGGVTGMPRHVRPGADGRVRICELPPADYRLTAMEGDLNEPLSLAAAHVSIRDRDATGMTLQPVPRFTIPAEFAWVGAPPEKPIEGLRLAFSLQSMTRSFGSFASARAAGPPPGRAEIQNAMMDDYSHRVYGLIARLYVKEVLFGNDNITYAPFRPGSQASGTVLRAVIGHDGAQVKARVRDRDGKPVPAATVIVMPAVFVSEPELGSALRTGAADQEGNYESVRAFAPGRYLALAVSPPVAEPLQADQVMRLANLRSQAREVTLEPNATAELTLEPLAWQ